jgi:hypothetical protein
MMPRREYVTKDFSFSVRAIYYGKHTAWEAQRLSDGSSKFFPYLTDALLYADNVTTLNDLSSGARMFWNTVALS